MLTHNRKLVKSILEFYNEIAKPIANQLPGKLKCICETSFGRQDGAFTVTAEIIIMNLIDTDDDYGLVFSTNAQPDTHYHGLKKGRVENGLYLVTDLSSGTGEIFDEIDEIIYYPDEELSNRRVLEIVKAFGISQLSTVIKILADRYDVKLDGG